MSKSGILQIFSAGAAGVIFGIGLIVSRMIDPKKIIDFLDVFGDWDPSLALVMAGAIFVTFFGYKITLNSEAPYFADAFRLPDRTDIDAKLLGGAALFGVGWGLAGLCPGPAIVDMSQNLISVTSFVVAMIVGINVYRFYLSVRSNRKPKSH